MSNGLMVYIIAGLFAFGFNYGRLRDECPDDTKIQTIVWAAHFATIWPIWLLIWLGFHFWSIVK